MPADNDGDQPNPVEFPPPSNPYSVARQLYEQFSDPDGLRTLLLYRGGWWEWRATHWVEIDLTKLRAYLYEVFADAYYMKDGEQTPWEPTRSKIGNVIDAMAAIGELSKNINSPAWIGAPDVTPAVNFMSCENGVLDLSTRTLRSHTATLFNTVSAPFAYNAYAPKPTVWLDFLRSVWPDDPEPILTLQQYFGYIVSGRTEQQKILALVGPTRAGKGTIAGVLTDMVGADNVANPTIASLSSHFGLMALIGKPFAVISDARLAGSTSTVLVERLLSLTGEDRLTIDQKYRDHWTGKLPTRYMLLSNELPQFQDASGAIANRFIALRMTRSWLGSEDRQLAGKLRAELPSIMNWALDGLDLLNDCGEFLVPASSRQLLTQMQDMASPVSAFVRDCCDITDPNAWITRASLSEVYQKWCKRNAITATATSTFGRDLRAVVPELTDTRRRYCGRQLWCYSHIRLNSPDSRW